jgi:hypothetical protein
VFKGEETNNLPLNSFGLPSATDFFAIVKKSQQKTLGKINALLKAWPPPPPILPGHPRMIVDRGYRLRWELLTTKPGTCTFKNNAAKIEIFLQN